MVYVVALFFNVLGNMTFWIIISKQSDPDTPPATGEAEAPGNFAKSLLWLVIFSPCSGKKAVNIFDLKTQINPDAQVWSLAHNGRPGSGRARLQVDDDEEDGEALL